MTPGADQAADVCPTCKGTGSALFYYRRANGALGKVWDDCPRCQAGRGHKPPQRPQPPRDPGRAA